MEPSLIIALIGIALSIATFCAGRLSAAGKKGEQAGTLLSDIAYLKLNTDDIKNELREQRSFNGNISERLTKCESEIKEVSHRLDDHINQ